MNAKRCIHISCGPFVNESEHQTVDYFMNKLIADETLGVWRLLSNVSLSTGKHCELPAEIDLIAVGTYGVHVIEIKHWDKNYIGDKLNTLRLEQEARRIDTKSKMVAGIVRKAGLGKLGFIPGKFLLTRAPKEKYSDGNERKKILGVDTYSLLDWKEILEIDSQVTLEPDEIDSLCIRLVPSTYVKLSTKINNFEDFSNLEEVQVSSNSFRKVYSARKRSSRDNVVLHIYDLTAIKDRNAHNIAKREFEVFQKLQKSQYLPCILDSFQEASTYPGEMFFFSYINPDAPTIIERSEDPGWEIFSRISTTKYCLNALREFHENNESPIIHRNILPYTIKVKSDNTPLFSEFNFAKIIGEETISDSITPCYKNFEKYVAPELKKNNLAEHTKESDIYSLCSSLVDIFNKCTNEPLKEDIIRILKTGAADDPKKRTSLKSICDKLSEERFSIKKEYVNDHLDVKYWDDNIIKVLNGRSYQIVTKLGSGSVGCTFKVMEVDPYTRNEISGPYVAKIITNEKIGENATKAYAHVRAQTGGPYLAGILEVNNKWDKKEISALMKWVDGEPFSQWKGVLLMYFDDLGKKAPEQAVLFFIRDLCQGLTQLHCANLVHGDVTPKNMIILGNHITLTDFDLSTTNGAKPLRGTQKFCSPEVENGEIIEFSDDIYSLAASFFEVLFDKSPFLYENSLAKEKGLNWKDIDISEYPLLTNFMNKATNSNRSLRYRDASEAFNAIDKLLKNISNDNKYKENKVGDEGLNIKYKQNEVPWLKQILQSYPSSPQGNIETRGLDSAFSWNTYVETSLDTMLAVEILDKKVNLVILCGNAGDGKTAFLQKLAENLALGKVNSSKRIWNVKKDDLHIRANLDGAASFENRPAQELLDEFFEPFKTGTWPPNIVNLIAINDGPLMAWLEKERENNKDYWLLDQLYSSINKDEGFKLDDRIRYIDLNARSLVGGFTNVSHNISTKFIDDLLSKTLGNPDVWKPCITCVAKNRCTVKRSIDALYHKEVGPVLQKRLIRILQAVHLRGKIHITARILRATINYILFGYLYCKDIHSNPNQQMNFYYNRAFDHGSLFRQGDLLTELESLDPGVDSHPRIDRHLLRFGTSEDYFPDNICDLKSLRRKAYFEVENEKIAKLAGGNEIALDIFQGAHLDKFLKVGMLNSDDQECKSICKSVCEGIAHLEDLPEQAFEENWVPLRITPRTPTETAFWVRKPLARFSLRPRNMWAPAGEDYLHTHIILTYTFNNGHTEELIIGEDLFHLLMEIKDGYQLSDVRSDDIFSNLSVFKQRLAQEDERSLFAWNPMDDNAFFIYINDTDGIQVLTIKLIVKKEGSNECQNKNQVFQEA